MPIAESRLIAPVGIDPTLTLVSVPMRMIDPLPQFFSICEMARFRAFFLSSVLIVVAILSPTL